MNIRILSAHPVCVGSDRIYYPRRYRIVAIAGNQFFANAFPLCIIIIVAACSKLLRNPCFQAAKVNTRTNPDVRVLLIIKTLGGDVLGSNTSRIADPRDLN